MVRDGASLLIRNINPDTDEEKIRELFSGFGELKDCYLPRDYHTKERRGFGFVEYTDDRDAEDSVKEMNGKEIDGNPISVEWAKQRRKSPRTMRSILRGGGGGRGGGRSRSRGRRSRSRGRRRRSYSRSRSRGRRSRSRDRGGRDRGRDREERKRSRSDSGRRRRSRSGSRR